MKPNTIYFNRWLYYLVLLARGYDNARAMRAAVDVSRQGIRERHT